MLNRGTTRITLDDMITNIRGYIFLILFTMVIISPPVQFYFLVSDLIRDTWIYMQNNHKEKSS